MTDFPYPCRQLEYIDKQIEIENTERNAREKLHAVRKQYGMNNANWKSRGNQDNFDAKAIGKATGKAGDSEREISLPPPPGLVPLSERKSQQAAPPKVDDFLDALISSTVAAPTGKESNSNNNQTQSKNKKQQQPQQQQQQHHQQHQHQQQQQQNDRSKGNKGDKKSTSKNEATFSADISGNIDLFEISQASVRMRLDQKSTMEASRAEAAREQNKDSKGRSNNKGKKEQQEAPPASTKAQESNDSRKGKSGDKKKAESDKRGRTVQVESQPDSRGGKLPPPPTLTVPPPSEQQNEGGEEEKKKSRRDRKKRGGKKEGGDDAEETAKEGGVDLKEPMLTKINIPFQKPAATAELPDSPVIPIPPRQSGPPKEPSLVVIPPKGPPAKELVPQASSEAPLREQTPKKSEDEATSGKSHGSTSESAEANLSGEKKSSGRKNRFKDNDKEETTTADASDNQPTSPAAGNREGSSRRKNVSTAAIMDSLMMVRPDSTSSPAKALSTEKSGSAEKEPTIVRSKSGGDEVKADA